MLTLLVAWQAGHSVFCKNLSSLILLCFDAVGWVRGSASHLSRHHSGLVRCVPKHALCVVCVFCSYVLNELIQTEKLYVEDLAQIVLVCTGSYSIK